MAPNLSTVGVIGAGKIGGTLIRGLSASQDFDLVINDASREQLQSFADNYDVRTVLSNEEVAGESHIIIVAVKPWDVETVLNNISPSFEGGKKAIVSVAAGVEISEMAGRLPERTAILRVMPNVCAAIGLGSAVITANEFGEAYLSTVMDIFRRLGDIVELPEELFDAATALHGSGPAYVALFADALVQAGVKEGIPRDVAKRLVAGTIGGTAVLLKEKEAYQIRDEVTTPGGTTAAALGAMEKAGFVPAVYEGIGAATKQARRLAG